MSILRQIWRKIFGLYCWTKEWLPFHFFLFWKCLASRKKAVLICRFGAMGDVVCSLPLCQAIRKKHPGCLLMFVTNHGFLDLVMQSTELDEVFGSKIWCWPFRFPPNFRVFGLVDAVYCPVNPDEINPENGASSHLVESLANSCGLFPKNLQPTLYPCEDDIAVYRTKYADGHKQLLIAINGGPTWPVRMWQTQKWQALVNKLHAEYSAEILLLGQMQAGRGADLMALRCVTNLFDQIDPGEIPALLKACDLLVAIDSGPIHIAGAVGTPVVGLFGAVNPKFRMPPDSPGKALVGNVPCLYCNHRIPVGHWKENCPHEIACMEAITVDQVFFAAVEILEKNPKAASCRKNKMPAQNS